MLHFSEKPSRFEVKVLDLLAKIFGFNFQCDANICTAFLFRLF